MSCDESSGTYVQRSSSDEYTEMGAVLSNDDEYRYRLWRKWDDELPTVAFLMVNPSDADGREDDPTIRRIVNYAKEWGYGEVVVGNLFAMRSPNPSDIHEHSSPVGPKNDCFLSEICDEAEMVVAAWGNNGEKLGRHREVVEMLDTELYVLNTTNNGNPVHPLYQKKDLEPSRFEEHTQ